MSPSSTAEAIDSETAVGTASASDHRVPVGQAFEELLADESRAPEESRIVSLDARRAAFEDFERAEVPGGRPGRDWKHDYARVAARIPWRTVGVTRLMHGFVAPPLESESLAAWAKASYPLVHVVRNDAREAGLRLTDLRSARRERHIASRSQPFGRAVRPHGDKFASLATAFANDGILIHVPASVELPGPVLIQHDTSLVGSAFPYIVVVLERDARATIVEDAVGDGFSCGIVECVVGEGALLDYVAVQRAGANAATLMNRGVVCGTGATCRLFVAELGGALSRSAVTTRLEGRGASSEIVSFFWTDGAQHVDLSSLVEHAVGDTTSRTTVKSAARDRGQGRYLGNIRIGPNANGSDAALRDDALLLSKESHIDSVPALEIASNDVKAFHGATVGSIDEEEMFYVESRGIDPTDAKRMIALGFFEPVVAQFPIESLRDVLRTSLGGKAGAAADAPTAA